jgi:hypothetical protein
MPCCVHVVPAFGAYFLRSVFKPVHKRTCGKDGCGGAPLRVTIKRCVVPGLKVAPMGIASWAHDFESLRSSVGGARSVNDLNRVARLQDVQLDALSVEHDFAFARHVEVKGGRTDSHLNRTIHQIDIGERTRACAEQAIDRTSVHFRHLSKNPNHAARPALGNGSKS